MTQPIRILLVEDDEVMRLSCRLVLTSEGHEVVEATSATEAEPRIYQEVFDLVITDLRMPGGGGQKVIQDVKRLTPGVPVLVITAYPSVESAVDAFRGGVADYLLKPFTGDQLLEAVDRSMSARQASDRASVLRACSAGGADMKEMVGASPAFRAMLAEVRRAAALDGNVLIWGETGAGKELVARAVHRYSRRGAGPYVVLNCAAVPDTLFEAELFGVERGAFTGANASKKGLLEEAHHGSIFLDEVADLSLAAQAKLLRCIEERTVRHLGSLTARPFDARIIAATHKDLRAEVAAGRFRMDLHYRLAVLELRVPPLRERPEDVAVLAVRFLDQLKGEGHYVGFSDEALRLLASYAWPGNVRELQNVVQKALARSEGPVIEAQDLVLPGLAAPRAAALPAAPDVEERSSAVAAFERDYVVGALRQNAGNISTTARALGVHRTTLQRMLKRLAVAAEEYR